MLNIGCHLSASAGFLAMGREITELGGNTFAFFTRNPRGGKARPVDEADIKAYTDFAQKHAFAKIVAHSPYTLNPCSPDKHTREFAHMVFEDDMKRMELIPGNYYNFHPGSHVGQGEEQGISLICEMLNKYLNEAQTTTVLLETMSGKGSEIGSSFEQLRLIMDNTSFPDKLGICLDTCHVYDAGYDIVNDLDGVLEQFDKIIGITNLKALHVNDSKNPYQSHKDRHEKIGKGFLGIKTFENLINHPKLKNLPFILETPNDLDGYAAEIALLKRLYKET